MTQETKEISHQCIDIPLSLEALTPLVGRDVVIQFQDAGIMRRGPLESVAFEEATRHTPDWYRLHFDWLAEKTGETWKLFDNNKCARVIPPKTTKMWSDLDGAVHTKLRGNVVFTFLPEENALKKPLENL